MNSAVSRAKAEPTLPRLKRTTEIGNRRRQPKHSPHTGSVARPAAPPTAPG
jgi:hypothetical protein